MKARLLLVSNRLPVTVKLEHNHVTVTQSAGGLATGLRGPHERSGGLWIGWPGETWRLNEVQRAELDRQLAEIRTVPLYLSASEVSRYYEGFANGVLWPLFHYLLDRIPMHARDWEAYKKVNQRFADLVVAQYEPGDVIWVQDYQLALLPGMLRERLPNARIGFFLHIPFPAAEIYQILPWRQALLEGLLGADLIGFHTLSYVRHFANALLNTLGIPTNIDRLAYHGREIRLGAFPMGVDAPAFEALAETDEANAEVEQIRHDAPRQRIILGIDRLDYTKGIPRRLLAIERLLDREPALRGRIRFIQVAVPSRTMIDEYAELRDRVHEIVGRINGVHGTVHSTPIHYLFRSFSPQHLAALYRVADVMLVTPMRDGMNLVAKEFVACRADEDGVLVLSEFAGAASELGEAVLVNPYDVDGMAGAIKRSLAMPREERQTRMRALRGRVFRSDVHHWAKSFLEELSRHEGYLVAPEDRLTPPKDLAALVEQLRAEPRLLCILDYDGTLVSFTGRPELAMPDAELHELLLALASRPGTMVHVISGRDREVLQRWLGDLPIGLHAEHGVWTRPDPRGEWSLVTDLRADWKERVREVLEQFVARVPGAFIEEKSTSLAWHYRMADGEFGANQAKELHLHISQTFSNVPVEVLAGDKVVEVRPHGVHKGLIVDRLKATAEGARMVALGDDKTDEDLFAALPGDGVAIHVGPKPSRAQYRVLDAVAARKLLWALVKH